MFEADLIAFLVFVVIGATVQAISGFAMGLIIMGGVTALGLADIGFSAAVVSLIAMVNTSVALRRTHRFIDRGIFARLAAGLILFTAVGVALLGYLAEAFYDLLRLLLGVVIIGAGSIMMLRPSPFTRVSLPAVVFATGAAGGVIGGLYGAGGAPLAWLMYRQPIAFQAIRATLLATFFTSTFTRTGVVIVSGSMTVDILVTAALAVPLVIASTVLGTRLAPIVPEAMIRRGVFGLLIVAGAMLIFQSVS